MNAMNINLHLAICGVLLLCLVASFLYRKFIDDHDDHNIHLSNNSTDLRTVNVQSEHCRRIEMLGTINKYLSIVIVLYLLAIGAMAVYSGWAASNQLG
jgi:hypothetical protein